MILCIYGSKTISDILASPHNLTRETKSSDIMVIFDYDRQYEHHHPKSEGKNCSCLDIC